MHNFGPRMVEPHRLGESQEEMVSRGGHIVHTTKVWVKHDDGWGSSEPSSPLSMDLEAQLEEDSQLQPLELEPVYLCDYHQHIRAEARRSRSPQ